MMLAIHAALHHISWRRVQLWFVIHMNYDDLFFFPECLANKELADALSGL